MVKSYETQTDVLGKQSVEVNNLKRSLVIKDLAIVDLSTEVQSLQSASFDGKFIWRINGFLAKRRRSLNGTT